MQRLLLALFMLAMGLPSCGRRTPLDLSGRWRVAQIEWTQNAQRVRLTAEGEIQVGRVKLPQGSGTFKTTVEAMRTVVVEVGQSGRDISGSVEATAAAPPSLLRQVGARPDSTVAEFSGTLANDTLGAIIVTTPDGQRRDVVLRIEEGGRRVIARAVPLFGESPKDASDIVLVRQG